MSMFRRRRIAGDGIRPAWEVDKISALNKERMEARLVEGWEPFAVAGGCVWLRRRKVNPALRGNVRRLTHVDPAVFETRTGRRVGA